MTPEVVFWFALAIKVLTTVGIVVAASAMAERSGPAIGSLFATLPVSTGPAYVFLSLDHDSTFIANTVLQGVVTNAGTPLFVAVYAAMAQRNGAIPSFVAALVSWVGFGLAMQYFAWTALSATLLSILMFAGCILATRSFRQAPMPPPRRKWYDMPLRACMVATLVLLVVTLSNTLGPAGTGLLSVYPVVFSSLILLLHPRVGGPATAAVLSHGIIGLAGFHTGLLAIQVTAVPLGLPVSLSIGLVIALGWNLTLFALRRPRRA